MKTSRIRSLMLTAALAGTATGARASPAAWQADTSKSRIVVRVFKKGLLSGTAHDHHFVPNEWRATASFDPTGPADVHVEVVIAAADSLRDDQPKLSPGDREKVNRQAAGRDVLDASRYREIRFKASKLELSAPALGQPAGKFQGVLVGTLSLHGRERSLSVRLVATAEGGGRRVVGMVSFKQSDFGIEPYSGFLGTIAVKDEVNVDFDLFLTTPAS